MRIVNPIVDQTSIPVAATQGLATQLWKTNSHKFEREIQDDHLPDYWHQRLGASHLLF